MPRKGKPVIARNLDGEIVNRYESIHDVSRKLKVLHPNVLYWVRTGYIKDGLKYEFENKEDNAPFTSYKYYHTKPKDNVELNRDKWHIIKYEVINKRVSITPCPYRRYPKPMVGSGLCQGCSSFRGRNKISHEVACGKKLIF